MANMANKQSLELMTVFYKYEKLRPTSVVIVVLRI